MTRGAMYMLYVILTMGVFFFALGNAYRLHQLRKKRNGDEPLLTAYVDRITAAELSVALFVLCLLVANWVPIVRAYTPWFTWWYWIGMGILLAGRTWLAFFISGDLKMRPSLATRIVGWLRSLR